MLTVDLEEWSDARLACVPLWCREAVPPSLVRPVERLLELLEERGARATFFVLGRVARRYPQLVRRIAAAHEVASHGDSHRDLSFLDSTGFRVELRASRDALEALTGERVRGYRAPNWSLARTIPRGSGAGESWAVRILEEEGFRYDSSLMPGKGFLFLEGDAGRSRRPHRLEGTSGLWEFPPTIWEAPGFSAPLAGGAFLRLLPLRCALGVLKRAREAGEIPHVHLHPWELERPAEAAKMVAGWRAVALFAGASGTMSKVSELLSLYRSVAIDDVRMELDRSGPSARTVAA